MQIIGPMKKESWRALKKITLEWITEAPDETEAHYHHAFALYQLGELDSAKTILKKVIKSNKNHALAYLYLYKISNKENQKDDMGYYKSRVLELDDSLIDQKNET